MQARYTRIFSDGSGQSRFEDLGDVPSWAKPVAAPQEPHRLYLSRLLRRSSGKQGQTSG
jgi:hypothetical protein